MLVAAHLNPLLTAHLRMVVRPPADALVVATSWFELESIVRHDPVDVLVVDPAADGTVRTAEIQQLMESFPSLPLVLYAHMTPANFRPLVDAARIGGVRHLVLHRFEDEPARFLALLQRLAGSALSEQMLEGMRPRLALLPSTLAHAIERMYRSPLSVRDVSDLAASAGMPTRTVYRHLGAAGFTSPMLLVKASRLLRAYGYARDPGHSMQDVAAKLRYSSHWRLVEHSRELLGLTPRRARHRLDPEQVVKKLLEKICAPASGRG